jgi:tryptophanyl-tRNA synthetase
MRPTGPLHLGHYFGALSNWVRMQEEYDCYYFIADWHALTTHYAEDTRLVPQNTREIVLDWLSTGIDPEKSTLFVQSSVIEHAELHLLLSMITPLEWLERVPTYKELISQLKDKDLGNYGFLGYPLLQTADIVMYDADLVPVGEDQVPHVELAREVVRRFNFLFGFRVRNEAFADKETVGRLLGKMPFLADTLRPPTGQDATPAKIDEFFARFLGEGSRELAQAIGKGAAEGGYKNFLKLMGSDRKFFEYKEALAEPAAMLTETPRFPGTDGRRMAKSFGNAIWLRDEPEVIRKKVLGMMTDPQRVRRTDPGRPEVCPVFAYHKLFSPPEVVAWSESGCRSAGIGCVECKRAMADHLVRWIEPVQQRRKQFEADPDRVNRILAEGSSRAHRVARRTMKRVREAVFGPSGRETRRPPAPASPPEPLWSESD